MAKAHREWKVLEHGPIQELAGNLWRVEGALPDMPLRRNMTIVRREDGELVVHNAIAVDDALRERIEGWGHVRWLLVPNGWHRLDAAAWKQRYPGATVLCPSGARKKVSEVVAVDGSYADFPATPSVELVSLAGLADVEGAMVVSSPNGTTLVVNDVIFNQPHLPGLFGFIYKALGQSGKPKITLLARLVMIKDKQALADDLRKLAAEPRLARIIVGHVDPITDRPAEVLRSLADDLAPPRV